MVEDLGYVGEEETEEEIIEEEIIETEEEIEEEVEEEIEEEQPIEKDKKELAIIKQKRENKKLKKQLEELRANKIEEEKKNEIEVLIEKGYGEEAAQDLIANKYDVAEIKRQLDISKIEKLEEELPGISDVSQEVYDLAKQSGFTPEEVYKAKFLDVSSYDYKTKVEQESLYRKQKVKASKSEVPTPKAPTSKAKLSEADKTIYDSLRRTKQFKSLTIEQFKEMVAE